MSQMSYKLILEVILLGPLKSPISTRRKHHGQWYNQRFTELVCNLVFSTLLLDVQVMQGHQFNSIMNELKDKFLTLKLDIYQTRVGSWSIGGDQTGINQKIGMTYVFSVVEDLGIRLKLDFLFPSSEEESQISWISSRFRICKGVSSGKTRQRILDCVYSEIEAINEIIGFRQEILWCPMLF